MIPKPPGARRRRILGPILNLTPLIDVILNLLFFFMVGTTLKTGEELKKAEGSVQVNLPVSESAVAPPKTDRPNITLDAEGKIYYRGQTLAEIELESTMRGLARAGSTEIDIRSDRDSHVGRALEIMDICKRAGITTVNFNAEKK